MGQVDKQNLVVHRWTANTACPGDYIYNLLPDLVMQVNKLINAEEDYLSDMTEQEFNKILDAKFNKLNEKIDKTAPVIYKYIEDIPVWAQSSVQKCLDRGFMVGTSTDSSGKAVLNLSGDLTRSIALLDRAGSFDAEKGTLLQGGAEAK